MLIKFKLPCVLIAVLVALGCDPNLTENPETLEGLNQGEMCALAAAHIQTCAGGLVAPPSLACNGDEELLLETPCEVIAEAAALEQSGKADSGWGWLLLLKLLILGCRFCW